MPEPLIAIDVALLPRGGFGATCLALSAGLPPAESQGLVLGPSARPHVTLTQQFVAVSALDLVLTRVDAVLRGQGPLAARVTGAVRSASSVSLAFGRNEALVGLHERLMAALADLEQSDGDATAFAGQARAKDVAWVRGFRANASAAHFAPHVTLGHAAAPPIVPAFDVSLGQVAVCHLGPFCSCRRILRQWDLL